MAELVRARGEYGDGSTVTPYLPTRDRSYESLLFQRGKPLTHAELNQLQQLLTERLRNFARALTLAGWRSVAPQDLAVTGPDQLRLAANQLVAEGWVLDLADPAAPDRALSYTLSPAPPSGTRSDLLGVEFWLHEVAPPVPPPPGSPTDADPTRQQVYPAGYADHPQPYPNDLMDPVLGTPTAFETARRVQLRWRLREVQGFDFSVLQNGQLQGLPGVYPRGGRTSPTTVYGYQPLNAYVWRAGAADPAAADALNTVDGYSYFVPLCRLDRQPTQTTVALDLRRQLSMVIPAGGVTDANLAPGIDAGKLTHGVLDGGLLAPGSVSNAALAAGIDAAKLGGTLPYAVLPVINNDKLGGLDAAKLSGTLDPARIPAGGITDAHIQGLNAAKLSGTVPLTVLPTARPQDPAAVGAASAGGVTGRLAWSDHAHAIAAGAIVDAHVAPGAAISAAKLNLLGAIRDAHVAENAAIAARKLDLTGAIGDAQVSPTAAINPTKINLAGYLTDAHIAPGAAINPQKIALTGYLTDAHIAPNAGISRSKLALGSGWITDADISPAAAIDSSKLQLTGRLTDAHIAPGAAINPQKINLTGYLVDAHIAPGAAINPQKIALTGYLTDAHIAPNAAIARSKLALGSGWIADSDVAAQAGIDPNKLDWTRPVQQPIVARGFTVPDGFVFIAEYGFFMRFASSAFVPTEYGLPVRYPYTLTHPPSSITAVPTQQFNLPTPIVTNIGQQGAVVHWNGIVAPSNAPMIGSYGFLVITV